LKKNILIATGGSGGHVMPATFFYDIISKEFSTYFVSDKRGINYLDESIKDLKIIDTPNLFNNYFLFPIKLLLIFKLTFQSIIFIKKRKINIVLSTGGYSTLPLCLAAFFLRIKLYLYEPNIIIGKANNFFLPYCTKIFCHSKKIKKIPKIYINKVLLISPIIRKIFYTKKYKPKNFFTILVIGGSQGAKIFDNTINKSIVTLSKIKKIKILHQTKKLNINYLKKFYKKYKVVNKVFSYESKVIQLLRKTDLCITRAGASTLFELIALNIPFITIPITKSSNNHQMENAQFYKKKNCCWVVKESDLNEIFLFKKLKNILFNKNEFLNKKKCLVKLSKKFKLKKQTEEIIKELNE